MSLLVHHNGCSVSTVKGLLSVFIVPHLSVLGLLLLLEIQLPEFMLNAFLPTSLASPLSWAWFVSLNFLDSKPQGSVLGLFPCLSESTPWMISTSLMVIAAASKLVFLPLHLSPYSDTAAKASLLKYESDYVILWLTLLQRLSSTSEEKLSSS